MHKKHTIDASEKKIGRVATEAAVVLMGKNDPAHKRHILPTSRVEIINCGKADVRDKKMRGKTYTWYSGYPGGSKGYEGGLQARGLWNASAQQAPGEDYEKSNNKRMTTKSVVKHSESKYTEAVGRRKTAIARVRVTLGAKEHFTVNEKPVADYFKTKELQHVVFSALRESGLTAGVTVKVEGGGTTAQAEAVRHGVARAAIIVDPELRKKLKKLGFLKRDPRAKERRKFGLKKARKAPQWSKR